MNPMITVILGAGGGGGGLYRNKPVLFCQCLQVVFNFFNLWFFNLQSTFKISYPELNKKSEIIS